MAVEPGTRGQEPNLELPPLLGFGRKKKRRRAAAEKEPVAEEYSAAEANADQSVSPETGGTAPEHPVAVEGPEPVRGPPPEPDLRAPLAQPAPEQPVMPLTYQPPPPAAPVEAQQGESVGWLEGADELDPQLSAVPRTRTPRTLPVINPRIAAVLTGALVGILGIGLASIASRGCEVIRGVGSCGGFGLLALLAVLAIEVVVGAIMLKAWRLSDPASTSFLGVGLVAVFVLLFLLSSLESVWMVVVIPALTALTFLTSWWVTTTFVEGISDDLTR